MNIRSRYLNGRMVAEEEMAIKPVDSERIAAIVRRAGRRKGR